MIKEIVKYPNPILRKRAKKIKKITDEVRVLAQGMVGAILEDKGIGLAAPQIGVSQRIIVVQIKDKPTVFINPKIVFKSIKKETLEEGCLSLPGVFADIKRSERITLIATTLDGSKVRIETSGLVARIFQHEIDHLNGVLFIDRISLLNRMKGLLERIKY